MKCGSCWRSIPATAGGMMNTEFVFVGEGSHREEVLAWIRSLELNLEQLGHHRPAGQ